MIRFSTPAALSDEAMRALEQTTGLSKAPALYRQIGNSEPSFIAYMGMERALEQCALSVRDIEMIKLYMSVRNECGFCRNTHHKKALAAGIPPEQAERLLAQQPSGDARLDCLLEALHSLIDTNTISDAQLAALSDQGFGEDAWVDLAMAAATISFTNWFNHINDTPA